MPNWDRVNLWTNTFYALIQALNIAEQVQFGNLPLIDRNVRRAATWTPQECSYASVLVAHPFGDRPIRFRRDPNSHFSDITGQVIKMLVQDLVVILDEMMSEVLHANGLRPANFPHSKVQQLAANVQPEHAWSAHGCTELIAVRNVLTHSGGRWNTRSLNLISGFVNPLPQVNERLVIGFPMLFRYRKAMRTFINQVS